MNQFIGKFTSALVSGSSENNISLANLNFEFSLVKLEAPAEFQPVGYSLSIGRRQTAELGAQHQLARVLGALFCQIVPHTPKLVQAFGKRVSEIITTPGANPKGTSADGPFKESVGADATSIWASATSGPSALAVLLLACMLARKFVDAKHSVAIWVELVGIRQREVLSEAKSSGFSVNETVLAAQQRILREDLAAFDASIRAWLITSDQVMIKKVKQLRLILDNLTTLPVSAGKDTYSKILSAWTAAMNGFEALLDGKPQNVTDSSMLLALPAWQLYPNLLVLADSEPKKVHFKDDLFLPSVEITVGLQWNQDDLDTPGFRWSLALSHLKYYGEAVSVLVDQDNFRITIEELGLIAFGSLLASWNVPRDLTEDVVSWVCDIGPAFRDHSRQEKSTYLYFEWFGVLFKAAHMLMNSPPQRRQECEKLISYGRRRGRNFLGGSAGSAEQESLFGLTNPHLIRALQFPPGQERQLQYLRSVVQRNEEKDNLLLVYHHVCTLCSVTVLATAYAHERWSTKRSEDGTRRKESVHARWIVLRTPEELSDDAHAEKTYLWGHIKSRNISSGKTRRHISGHKIRRNLVPLCREVTPADVLKGHQNAPVPVEALTPDHQQSPFGCCAQHSFLEAVGKHLLAYMKLLFRAFFGRLSPESAVKELKKVELNKESVCEYLQEISLRETGETSPLLALQLRPDWIDDVWEDLPYMDSLHNVDIALSIRCQTSLTALWLIAQVCKQFPSASFPIKVAERPFDLYDDIIRAHGMRGPSSRLLKTLTRPEALAGICMLELGGASVSTSYLHRAFAVSAGNSIFVAECLLSDPSERVPDHAIRRIVGNLGKPGISILVSPRNLKVKERTDDFRAVEHAQYDTVRSDSFPGVSLHLSLTEWCMAVATLDHVYGHIDRDIFLIEAAISVHDKGRWYADIDILDDVYSFNLPVLKGHCRCGNPTKSPPRAYTSIDTFDELLDPPESVGIVRAHKNWPARLAAACIVRQRLNTDGAFFLSCKDIECWTCLERLFDDGDDDDDDYNDETKCVLLEDDSDAECAKGNCDDKDGKDGDDDPDDGDDMALFGMTKEDMEYYRSFSEEDRVIIFID
ncbi:hypothetical protein H2204_008636 [Knufia peltigerae]|uniref:Uncharacterized protein n=1 Tax=Knufia peltigerae TaxID=1002370 RepID=A0AA38XZI3_9EURO|nr:hypothetical protein H2204_008636 [Knufia peltigerae]